MKNIIFMLLLPLAGCVTLPKETVMLSGEMGTMIQSAKAAHVELLNEFERQQISKIDLYLQMTWNPEMVGEMAKGGDLWGKTCGRKDTLTATMELTGFVQAAAKRIARKRQELTDALDTQMLDLRVAVDQHYDTLALSNKTVTDNLRSIRRNDEVFEETLKMVKQDKDLPAAMRVVSDKLDKLMVK